MYLFKNFKCFRFHTMASSSSLEIIDDVHEKTETLSVYNCIFCNILLNGQAVLLDCLHIICHICLGEKLNDSGKFIVSISFCWLYM